MKSTRDTTRDPSRRTGDAVKIDGGYQHRALLEGNKVQRFWHYSKQSLISRLLPPQASDRILDVGCGSGVICGFLGRSGATVMGMDGSKDAVDFARKNYAQDNVTFRQGLVDEDFCMESLVDKIYCLEVIEHIHRPQAADMLGIFSDSLKPGGHVLLTTPNYHSAWPLIEWAMDRLSSCPPLKDDQHVEHYHARKLRELCESTGFQVSRLVTTCFIAPWLAVLSWSLAKAVDRWEAKLPGYMGSILACILKKPE